MLARALGGVLPVMAGHLHRSAVRLLAGLLLLAGVLLTGCSVTGTAVPAAGRTPSAPVETTEPVAPPRALFFGDSYTVGFGATSGTGYVGTTATAMGWTPVLNAQSGTGYLNPSTTPGQTSYFGRLAQVQPSDPDIVLVQGSTNDVGQPPAAVEVAAAEFYRGLRAAVPDAQVVVLGPLGPPGIDPVLIAGIRDALYRAATAAGVPYIDPIAEGWLASPTLFVDTVHPSDAGYAELSADLVRDLRALGF